MCTIPSCAQLLHTSGSTLKDDFDHPGVQE